MPSSIANILASAISELVAAKSPSASVDASVLLCHVLDKPSSYLYTWPERKLTHAELSQFRQLLARRLQGEPVAYIIGYRDFWSLRLDVSPSTLIPRPDTERLVELALGKVLPQTRTVLDLGTGTGAIALALASECPHINVTGVDVKIEAVELAERNRKANKLDNVRFLQSSWFDALETDYSADVIVSNPPYIDPADPHLEQGDVRFEPKSALVAEQQGLSDIMHICGQGFSTVVNGGWLLVEHGYDQGQVVREIFSQAGWIDVTTEQDYAGLDRVTLGRKAEEK